MNGEPKEQRDPYQVSVQATMGTRMLQWCFTCAVGETDGLTLRIYDNLELIEGQ
jgi:hypothetical protein